MQMTTPWGLFYKPGSEPTKVKCNYIFPNVITFAKLRPTKPEGGKCNYNQILLHLTHYIDQMQLHLLDFESRDLDNGCC